MRPFFSFLAAVLLSSVPLQAQAYIGPGMGLGMAGVVLGLFVAFILLLAGLIWLPIRRFLRQRKQSRKESVKLKTPPGSEG
jgi:flagellar biogenesis protein FliO